MIRELQDKGEAVPESMRTCYKCGVVLFRRHLYDKGEHDNDVKDCEIEYRAVSDERLQDNFDKLYKIIKLNAI